MRRISGVKEGVVRRIRLPAACVEPTPLLLCRKVHLRVAESQEPAHSGT
jgi:hypothetical protein